MRRLLCTIVCLACGWGAAFGAGPGPKGEGVLGWTELPDLPPPPGQQGQLGLAGAFTGMAGDAMIVAGGANFPDLPPWKGGEKVWHDLIYVLRPVSERVVGWLKNETLRLPRPLAYGVAIGTDEGLLCIGGCDADRCYPDVFLLAWDAKAATVSVKPMPPLPRPLAFMAGAKVGNVVYVAGGQETMAEARATTNFWALDLSKPVEERAWRELPPWPGPPRLLPVAAAQSDGSADAFYLFSGRDVAPGAETRPLTDAYRYAPSTGRWQRLADVAPAGQTPRCIMGAPAIASGAGHVLVFGGDDGRLLVRVEQLGREMKEASEPGQLDLLAKKRLAILTLHPGFSRDILAYHTITDTWTEVGRLPGACQVTTAAFRRRGAVVIATGEVRPGVRTCKIWKGEPPPPQGFGWANYAVLGAYLASLVAMGVYFSRREKTTDDYFRAGRRVPWWAAGLSIYGTQLSAITFLAIPAKTFATDWRYFMLNMAIVLVAPAIIWFILPFFRRLNVTTAYEYLEKRFNVAARLIGSAMFIALHLGRIGIILFLPSIALNVVTGIDVRVCIVVMGLLSIAYTVLGGIEAVIWTDVLQAIVLLGGGGLAMILILAGLPGGAGGLVDVAEAAGKLHAFDFRFDLTQPTFWVVVLGGLAVSFISYGTDQTVIQRYLTTKDEKAAARSIRLNAVLVVPGTVLFFGLGTALYVFYKARPELMNPTIAQADAIFPWYIVTQLPAGVAGLLIAAVFAAAMSSLDSSMNSVATAVTTDFYRRLRPAAADRTCLALARGVTVAVGLAGMAFALVMTGWDVRSLWDEFSRIIGLFAGGLGGLFLLGIFSRRAHGLGALVGLAASAAVQFAVGRTGAVHLLLYSFTGLASCLVVGYVASLLIPSAPKPLDGLTFYTLAPKHDPGTEGAS